MKKGLLLLIVLAFGLGTFAQQRVAVPQAMRNVKYTKKIGAVTETTNQNTSVVIRDASVYGWPEEEYGQTIYDLQSNGSSPYGRVIRFADGSFSAVYTRGTGPTAYNDRGTGYNYNDGTSWGTEPTGRIESVRCGWPSIAQLGASGEAVVSHRSGTTPLRFSSRSAKGTGTWAQSDITPPTGASGLLWPRMVSGGTDHNTLHVIALTAPTANGGTVYNGQDGAIVYTKSTDGGATWTTPTVLPGLGAADYVAFGGDNYEFAEPQGNNVAFALVDNSNDLVVMRSTDDGTTWTKTIVWANPYPHLDPATTATDTLYAPDATVSLAFDNTGKLHMAFGVYRLFFTGTGSYSYYPGLSGIAYWNEDLPTYTGGDQMNILNPDSLDAHGLQIGYYNIDWNGNGLLDYVNPFDYGDYGVAWASMPQIAFDENNNLIFIYSSITENFDNGTQQYRHIWCRAASNVGNPAEYWGPISDLSDDPIHTFDECVFPSLCANSDATAWYFTYQLDNEPGLAVRGDLDPPGDNYMNFYHISKLLNKVNDPKAVSGLDVSDNYPNPVSGVTTIDVTMPKAAQVIVNIHNLTGQQVSSVNYGVQTAGIHKLNIDASKLASGVYFYTVNVGQQNVTKKMVVK
ncbi:MAG: T9SS type A sorting domain-containing protein [Bacteroidetes bacterium]|nr:T9SS type A sorting domain-containing protein [Bacteroidota bacterium]